MLLLESNDFDTACIPSIGDLLELRKWQNPYRNILFEHKSYPNRLMMQNCHAGSLPIASTRNIVAGLVAHPLLHLQLYRNRLPTPCKISTDISLFDYVLTQLPDSQSSRVATPANQSRLRQFPSLILKLGYTTLRTKSTVICSSV